MIVRFLIFAVLVLMIDVYFYQGVRSLVSKWSARRKKTTFVIYWGFTGFAIALMLIASFMSRGYANHGFQQYAFNVILIVTLAKFLGLVPLLINDLYRLVHLFIGLFHQKKEKTDDSTKLSRLQFFNRAAVGLAAIPMVALIYGMVKTAFDFTVRKETIKLPNLPAAFDGLKILQISDIHSGSFVSEEPFKKAIKLINEQKPDIIFFTGDLVNDRSLEAERFINVLSTIKAPMGVYSVLGNHDYGDYVDIDEWGGEEAKKANLDRLKEIHGLVGWKLLLNENVILTRNGESIAVVGIENWGNKLHFPRYGKMDIATQGTEGIPVKLLLSHDPSHWEGEVLPKYPDIDITFSGHTHGFQFGIEIPGLKWSPSQYVYKQWAGLYNQGKQYIYVNRGFGFLGYLGRVGIPPEITVITLNKA